jgi:hypothetical protein
LNQLPIFVERESLRPFDHPPTQKFVPEKAQQTNLATQHVVVQPSTNSMKMRLRHKAFIILWLIVSPFTSQAQDFSSGGGPGEKEWVAGGGKGWGVNE